MRAASIEYLIDSNVSPYINLHSRICHKLDVKEEAQFTHLYRGIFTIRPRKHIEIFLEVKKRTILTVLYNSVDSEISRIELTMEYVKRFLPFIEDSLANRQFLNIGIRLFRCLKNTLLIEYFTKRSKLLD